MQSVARSDKSIPPQGALDLGPLPERALPGPEIDEPALDLSEAEHGFAEMQIELPIPETWSRIEPFPGHKPAWEWIDWALRLPPIARDKGGVPASSWPRLVMLALVRHMNKAGRAFPTQKRLAGLAQMSERSIRRWIGAFRREGWLRTSRWRHRGNGRVYMGYQLSVAPPEPDRRLSGSGPDRRLSGSGPDRRLSGSDLMRNYQKIETNGRARTRMDGNGENPAELMYAEVEMARELGMPPDADHDPGPVRHWLRRKARALGMPDDVQDPRGTLDWLRNERRAAT